MHSQELIANIKLMRRKHKPEEIAKIIGKSKGAIDQILHREKKKGASYPKLRHGNLKYDTAKAEEWRGMLRQGNKYPDIQQLQGVNVSVISRILGLESRGELGW